MMKPQQLSKISYATSALIYEIDELQKMTGRLHDMIGGDPAKHLEWLEVLAIRLSTIDDMLAELQQAVKEQP